MGFLIPRDRFRRITDISLADLNALGIDTVLLDVDNTLSRHHAPEPAEGVAAWIEAVKASGRRLIIVSNSAEKRVKPFAEQLGLPYRCHAAKPLPVVLRRTIRQFGAERKRTALIGDQLLTDVLGARFAGVKILLLHYIEIETAFGLRLKRAIEYPLLKNKTYHGEEK